MPKCDSNDEVILEGRKQSKALISVDVRKLKEIFEKH